jgi:hypothetical protein
MTLYSDDHMEEMLADLARREAADRVERADEILAMRTNSVPEMRQEIRQEIPRRNRQAMTHDIAVGWQNYIAREIQAAERRTAEACMAAVAEVLLKERGERERLEAELASLKLELAELRGGNKSS